MLIMLNKSGFRLSFDVLLPISGDTNFIVIARGYEALTGRVNVLFSMQLNTAMILIGTFNEGNIWYYLVKI